ncbi:pyrimidine utilization protein D [Novosphingobium sp. Leaf2]|uniref:pyrimidine utilization protein D n=1 Tax=Novosphingobium sp. Leaf2 TaxID=1735670 RepID=UPI0006F633EC|nr:pyrimidine utilization protein D [Novosphingobium sp. Leaf2]KQM18262.1 pyrimidine utilization protein D [Novosphingobium sp. Leaf2]
MPRTAGIYWERHGDPALPALILSAGLGGAGDYWHPNIDALAHAFCVHIYDHRGTARSDRAMPDTVDADFLADDLALLIDALRLERPVIIGHAAGALAGLALALRSPGQLGGLILVNGWSRPNPHFRRCIEMRLAVLEQGGPQAYFRAQPVFLFPANWVTRNDARLQAQLAEQVETFQGAATLRARAQALMAFDIDDRLGEIMTPTLVIVADDDVLVPALCSDRLHAGIAGSGIARMPTGGHGCNVTCPDQFNTIVRDWLSGMAARGD